MKLSAHALPGPLLTLLRKPLLLQHSMLGILIVFHFVAITVLGFQPLMSHAVRSQWQQTLFFLTLQPFVMGQLVPRSLLVGTAW